MLFNYCVRKSLTKKELIKVVYIHFYQNTLPVYIILNTGIEILNNDATSKYINNTEQKGCYLRDIATSNIKVLAESTRFIL